MQQIGFIFLMQNVINFSFLFRWKKKEKTQVYALSIQAQTKQGLKYKMPSTKLSHDSLHKNIVFAALKHDNYDDKFH